MAFASQE